MEKSAILAMGNPLIFKEIVEDHSDGMIFNICDSCGHPAERDIS
jgi:hypothetical protein